MTRYGFEHEKPERLAGIEATWDPGTRALLDSLGVGSGWSCLEAGAGRHHGSALLRRLERKPLS